MKANEEFIIKYVDPGIVRAGRGDRTDFCLLYHEGNGRLYFFGVGIWNGQDELIGYEVKIPKELKDPVLGSSWFPKKDLIVGRIKDLIVGRIKGYIDSKDLKRLRNVSIEDY